MLEESRVLIYTTAFRPFIGGSEIALEENIRHLPDIFFDIFTPRYSRKLKAKECASNFCLHRIGLGLPIDKHLFPLLGFLASIPYMDRSKILHSYQASFGALAACLAKSFFIKKRLIVTLQEGKDIYGQNLILKIMRKWILKKSDIITAISSYLYNYASSINKKSEIVIIPNGVDLKKFKVAGERDKNTLITVSRLVEKNGIGDLIKAMRIVIEKIPEAKLLIVGSGPLEESLKLKAKSLKLENNIEFIGSVIYDDIPKYLSQANIFVRPSLSEGLGSAFLEAMATGLAVVGTSVGGIPDFLKDGETGLFCRSGDPEDIADKLVKLMEDDLLRQALIINARNLVEDKYDWNKISTKFREIYER